MSSFCGHNYTRLDCLSAAAPIGDEWLRAQQTQSSRQYELKIGSNFISNIYCCDIQFIILNALFSICYSQLAIIKLRPLFHLKGLQSSLQTSLALHWDQIFWRESHIDWQETTINGPKATLVKFHLIALPSVPGQAFFKYENKGCASLPLTLIGWNITSFVENPDEKSLIWHVVPDSNFDFNMYLALRTKVDHVIKLPDCTGKEALLGLANRTFQPTCPIAHNYWEYIHNERQHWPPVGPWGKTKNATLSLNSERDIMRSFSRLSASNWYI